MAGLFESFTLGPISLKNRFIRSATGEGRADKEGVVKDTIAPIYEELAAGGVGLIITGHMYVHPVGKCSPGQTGIWDEKHVEGLRHMARVSQANDTRVVAQLNLAARKPEEMSAHDIRTAAEAYVAAAARAVEAGFDGVQIHGAHGYLLSGFLTPSENQRRDEYGQDAEGRRRLLLEVTERTREAIGPNKLLLCKLGVVDGRDNSLPLEESIATAQALEGAGLDGLEISTTFSGDHAEAVAKGINEPDKEAYFQDQARALKQALGMPLILVGGLRSLAVMERMVHEGVCDLVSLCRPFIRQPDFVNRLRERLASGVDCISCNACFGTRAFRCPHVDKP